MATQSEKAQLLRSLHHGDKPLVLVNAWDAVSALIVESLGFPAVATSSSAIANLEGYDDGQRIPRDVMLAGIARVARAVSVPVTGDLEAGYGLGIEDAAETARGAIAAGAVGLNFEDNTGNGLIDVALQCERIRAIRRVADESGVALVINARTDPFLIDSSDTLDEKLRSAIERGNAYRTAGADSIFVPFAPDAQAIKHLVDAIDAPINILATKDGPSLVDLARLGVKRISYGAAPAAYALAAFRNAARSVLDGAPNDWLAQRIPSSELRALFR